jgi:hypothetical protein
VIGLPPGQVHSVALHDLQQPIVIDFAKGLIGLILDEEPKVCEQLAKAHAR